MTEIILQRLDYAPKDFYYAKPIIDARILCFHELFL